MKIEVVRYICNSCDSKVGIEGIAVPLYCPYCGSKVVVSHGDLIEIEGHFACASDE